MNEDMAMNFPKSFPAQKQDKQPGIEENMNPRPVFDDPNYVASDKLLGKVALITGGDSGIGRAVAVAYAKEGADIAIVYLDEHKDAEETKKIVESAGRKCLLIPGDIGDENFCKDAIQKVINAFGRIDILVNNAAEQHPQNSIEDITAQQLERTFKTNFFGPFYLTKAAIPHLKPGSSIINTTSITAYRGEKQLIDYSCTKGALATFTRSMAKSLINMNIRVNAVAPGPIWTPLIPSSFREQDVAKFGSTNPMGRPGQPVELAGAYVFLASADSSYVTGQTIHVNGGAEVNV
ncbi:SDR family oxidoreductase [Fonticella tunisiensis]|uniref:NAD(P)-dependent dehydrogenase (Short-subunit alcohol dehydrogenase family) n=1 Tax=Fonticella tunisiensis TaxID=1096341 RepID=A0A4R7KBI3_9CLOT|nr:SDR family oxidoreductase [Fonticella tunisiensis]TDT51053.1 NAD(P)-dependent dehydrogenase (short-subunit alcohol dehydrogenase family) [Fonticella tunisiensis]